MRTGCSHTLFPSFSSLLYRTQVSNLMDRHFTSFTRTRQVDTGSRHSKQSLFDRNCEAHSLFCQLVQREEWKKKQMPSRKEEVRRSLLFLMLGRVRKGRGKEPIYAHTSADFNKDKDDVLLISCFKRVFFLRRPPSSGDWNDERKGRRKEKLGRRKAIMIHSQASLYPHLSQGINIIWSQDN